MSKKHYTLPLPLHCRIRRSILENRPIIISPIRRVRNRIVPKTGIIIIRQRIAARLALNKASQITHPVDAPARCVPACPAADRVQGQDAVVQPHPDELVGRVSGVVAVLRGRVRRAVGRDGSGITDGAADDFGDEAAAEGRHVGEDEGPVWVGRELG